MPRPKKILIQKHVSQTTAKKLDALARAVGCSRATYVGRILQSHVKSVSPALVRAIDQSSPDSVLEGS